MFCTCTSTTLIPSVATWLSGQLGIFQTHASFDLVAACAGFPYGLAEATRLLQEVRRPVLVVCAEKFSDKIGSVRTSRMIFGDGAAAVVVAPAGDDEPGDVEVLQTYASGPASEVNSIIWPNPRVRQRHHRLRARGALARRPLPRADDRRAAASCRTPTASDGTLLDAVDLVVPHQANKTMVTELARERRAERRPAVLQHRGRRQRLGGEHPAGDPRRGRRRRHRPPAARVRAGLRRRRGRRLRRAAHRPGDRRPVARRRGAADARPRRAPTGPRGPRRRTCTRRSATDAGGLAAGADRREVRRQPYGLPGDHGRRRRPVSRPPRPARASGR